MARLSIRIRAMENRPIRLSKPLYESLPYAYMVAGLLAFAGAYRMAGKIWSDVALVIGIACLLGGLVLVLRRREYRTTRTHYSGAPIDRSG